MAHRISSAAQTHTGRKRSTNEDRFAIDRDIDLYILADGVGGHRAGGTAASIAVEAMLDAFANADRRELRTPEQRLVHAIEHANRIVYEAGMWDVEKHRMSTTCVTASIEDDQLALAHVGDSRAYRVRQGELVRMTRDHSVAEEYEQLVLRDDQGRIRRNVITRALGMRERVEVSVSTHVIVEGDRFMLCSDGLSNMVPSDMIRFVLANAQTADLACEELIAQANSNGGNDNITMIVLICT